MGYFDDLVPADSASGGGFFDDLVPGAAQPAPEPRAPRVMPDDPTGLPPTWDVDLGGKKWRSSLTKLPDGRTVYTIPLQDGRTGIVQRRRDNGALMLKPYEPPKGSNGLVRDVKDAVQGQLQGIADVVVNAPARLVDIAVNAPARAIDRVFGLEGPSLDQLAADAIGTAPSLDQALANQNEGFRQSTGDSEAGRIGRIGGNVTGAIPLAAGRVVEGTGGVANLLNGAAQGGATSGMTAIGRGSDDVGAETAGGALAGAFIGAVAPPAISAAAGAYKKTKDALMPAATVTDDLVQQARQAVSRAQLSWDELDDPLRNRILKEMQAARAISDSIPDDAIVRKAVYESQGLKPTRAMVTRDWTDAWREQNLMTEPEGDALRNVYVRNNATIRQTLDDLAPRDVSAVEAPAFGDVLRKSLAGNERRAQGLTQKAWEQADAAEGGQEVTSDPLLNYWRQNAEALAKTDAGQNVIQHMRDIGVLAPANSKVTVSSSIGSRGGSTPAADQTAAKFEFSPFGVAKEVVPESQIGKSAGGTKTIQYRPVNADDAAGLSPKVNEEFSFATGTKYSKQPLTLRQLQSLRQIVNEEWKTATGTAKVQLNQMRSVLNDMEEGAGGEMFKAYRQIRTAKGARYENNPLIDKLLSDKTGFYGTDAVEDSKVFDMAVLKSSPEQFGKLWPRLTPKARSLTQAQMADHIKQQVFSNQGRNEAGDVVASAAKLDKVLRDIGPQKLRLIFGEQRAKDMQMLARSLGEISNPPKGTVPQGSAPKLGFLSRALFGVLNFGGNATGSALLAGGAEGLRRGGQTLANKDAAAVALDLYGPYRREALQQLGSRFGLFATPPAGVAGGLLLGGPIAEGADKVSAKLRPVK